MPSPPLSPTQEFRESNASLGAIGAKLHTYEIHWRDKYQFLAARGYTLRQRYHPDWKPSWEAHPDTSPLQFEDYWHSPYGRVIDATRNADGGLVSIKQVTSDSQELEIANFFSQPDLRADPRNHCIPIIESFPDDRLENVSYIVMPFLRRMDDPPFDFVGDVLDFADQVIEGLAFIHEHYVAHRDCAPSNLFMDAHALYPRGFHPIFKDHLPDYHTEASPYSRASAPGAVKYFFADFGMSLRFPPGIPRQVLGRTGADKEVPELSDEVPYDPFKTDVFILGNTLRRRIHDKYFRVEFLRPMIISMTQRNPDDRPSAEAALSQWKHIRKHVSAFQRVCRLRARDEGIVTALVSDILSLFKVSFIIAGRLLHWSSDWLSLLLG